MGAGGSVQLQPEGALMSKAAFISTNVAGTGPDGNINSVLQRRAAQRGQEKPGRMGILH